VNRELLRNVLVGSLGVVAVALAALTLPSARQHDPREGSSGIAGSGGEIFTEGGGASYGLFDLFWFKAFLTVVGVVCLVILLRVLLEDWVRVAVSLVAMVFIVFFYQALFAFAPPAKPHDRKINASNIPSPTATPTPVPGGSGAAGSGSSGALGLPATEPLVVLLVIGVAIVGVALVARRQRGARQDDSAADTDEDTSQAAAVGRAAGRAADRIEATGLDNEVYRAWGEMTQLLDVDDPETNTPREFEAAAVEAGMERADVEELTDLFERVRYGEYTAASADEQRAVELLRHIESTYTEGDE